MHGKFPDLQTEELNVSEKDPSGLLRILDSGAIHPDQIREFVKAADTPETTRQEILETLEKVLRKRNRGPGTS